MCQACATITANAALMCQACATITANAARRYDPTRTTTLRQQFEADLARRFRAIAKAIRKKIDEEDGFGLKTNRGEFEFARSDQKVAAFMEWLQRQVDAGILEIRRGETMQQAGQRAWTNVYIRSAYQKGIAQSAARLRAEGAQVAPEWVETAFTRPFHADRVGLVYTRTFNDLRGITAEMDKQISRTLANGLAEGLGPMDIARSLANRVEKIGIVRARMLARTEVVAAHAEASLNVFDEAEAEGVSLEAEFTTAQDDKVCQECQALAEKTFTIREARGMLPVHPNCRCTWLPVVKNPREVNLR